MNIQEIKARAIEEGRERFLYLNQFDRFDENIPYPITELADFKPEYERFGPHQEVIDKIQGFNQRWGLNLKATNTFRFSPGYMDEVKKRMCEIMFHRLTKKTKLRLLVEKSEWRFNQFTEQLLEIEQDVTNLRLQGVTLKNSIDDGEEAWDMFIGALLSSGILEYASDVYVTDSGLGVLARHYSYSDHRRTIPRNEQYISIVFKLKDIVMNVFANADKDGRIHTENDQWRQIVASLPFGDVDILFELNLHNWVNTYRNETPTSWNSRRRNYYNLQGFGITRPHVNGLYFPYIQRDRLSTFSIGNICFGDVLEDIKAAVHLMDFKKVSELLQNWATTYVIGHTGPLNSLPEMIIGTRPEYTEHLTFPEQYHKNLSTLIPASSSTCTRVFRKELDSDAELMKSKYCIDCDVQNSCNLYTRTLNDTRLEDIERIGSIIDDTYGPEYAGMMSFEEDSRTFIMGFDVDMLIRDYCQRNEDGLLEFNNNLHRMCQSFISLYHLKKKDIYWSWHHPTESAHPMEFINFAIECERWGLGADGYEDRVDEQRRLKSEFKRQEAALAALEENNNTDEEEVSEVTEENILERYPQVAEELRRIANRENL